MYGGSDDRPDGHGVGLLRGTGQKSIGVDGHAARDGGLAHGGCLGLGCPLGLLCLRLELTVTIVSSRYIIPNG